MCRRAGCLDYALRTGTSTSSSRARSKLYTTYILVYICSTRALTLIWRYAGREGSMIQFHRCPFTKHTICAVDAFQREKKCVRKQSTLGSATPQQNQYRRNQINIYYMLDAYRLEKINSDSTKVHHTKTHSYVFRQYQCVAVAQTKLRPSNMVFLLILLQIPPTARLAQRIKGNS